MCASASARRHTAIASVHASRTRDQSRLRAAAETNADLRRRRVLDGGRRSAAIAFARCLGVRRRTGAEEHAFENPNERSLEVLVVVRVDERVEHRVAIAAPHSAHNTWNAY